MSGPAASAASIDAAVAFAPLTHSATRLPRRSSRSLHAAAVDAAPAPSATVTVTSRAP